ncbi:hypothetical protein KEM54_002207 [Ascosphaera aggregata]|nr:hypothetical protein KEM54_002207 [Ascosphaera aggregata]
MSSHPDETGTAVAPTLDNRENDSTSHSAPQSEESLELRIARVVGALAQVDQGPQRPQQPLDFLGIPKARHVLDALAALLSSDDMNYAVAYTVTTEKLVILIAADKPVHQDKVVFVDTVLAKGRLLLAKETKNSRLVCELRSKDLRDKDVVDFFRYVINFDFSTFKNNFTSHQAVINEFHQHLDYIPMSASARGRLAKFRYLFNATAKRFDEINAELQDPVKVFDNTTLLAMWVLVAYSLGDIESNEWMEIDRGAQERCSQRKGTRDLPYTSSHVSDRHVTLVFRRAIILETGLRYSRTRRLLNRPYRVTKVDTMPSIEQLPKAMTKVQWIDFLKPIIDPDSPAGQVFVDQLASDLSSDGTDEPEQIRQRTEIHAELKLLAFFRVHKQWCSRIVVTGKPCVACCIVLGNSLNAKERHHQHIKARKGCTPGWVLPVGILSNEALQKCYVALCKRLVRVSTARISRTVVPLSMVPPKVLSDSPACAEAETGPPSQLPLE